MKSINLISAFEIVDDIDEINEFADDADKNMAVNFESIHSRPYMDLLEAKKALQNERKSVFSESRNEHSSQKVVLTVGSDEAPIDHFSDLINSPDTERIFIDVIEVNQDDEDSIIFELHLDVIALYDHQSGIFWLQKEWIRGADWHASHKTKREEGRLALSNAIYLADSGSAKSVLCKSEAMKAKMIFERVGTEEYIEAATKIGAAFIGLENNQITIDYFCDLLEGALDEIKMY